MKLRALLIGPLGALVGFPLAPAASVSVATPPVRSARAAALLPTQRFRFDAGAPLLAPAAVAEDGTLCVGTADGYVHSLNADGSYRWSHSVPGAIRRRPLHVGGLWYVVTSGARVVALGAEGTVAWVFKAPNEVNSELAADADGTAYFVGIDRFLYGLTAHGAVTVRAPFGEPKAGPERGADGAIWAENQRGELFQVRARRVRRVGPEQHGPGVFSDARILTDPEGHEWQGRSDGVLEFRAVRSAGVRELALAQSPLFAPIWSSAGHYAVLSARSGLVFALEPVPTSPRQ